MKTIFLGLLGAIIVSFSSISILAQARPCLNAYNCGSPWVNVLITFIPASCGTSCSIEVLYAVRHCISPGPTDIDILQITSDATCTCSQYDMLADALEAVLANEGLIPSSVGCNTDVRIMSAQCMKRTYVNGPAGPGTRISLELCASGGCCYQTLQICRDSWGNVTIVAVYPSGLDQTNSEPYYCPPWDGSAQPIDGNCYLNCNWIQHTRFAESLPAPRKDNSPELDIHRDASSVVSRPDGLITGKVFVVDWQGKVVLEVTAENMHTFELEYKISTNSRLTSGVYGYSFIQAGKSYHGTVSVVK
ncbi:MAG: hypothetical protein RL156_759 [Bacteroidota bacterium]